MAVGRGFIMLDFTFQNTTKIIFGKDTELQVGQETAKYAKNILIVHTGEAFFEPLLNRIRGSLTDSGVSFVEVTGVKPNPELVPIYKGIELCRAKNLGLILAVGGGSVIDTAKSIAAGVLYDGDVWDLFTRKATFCKALPTAAIVTLPATGSESSCGAVASNAETGFKLDIIDNCLRPAFAILNPELTYTLPDWHTFCGIVDIMSHTMERYFTNTDHVELIDRLSEGLLATCIHNARKLLKNRVDYNARAEIMWAATVSHNDLLGTGRASDWVSHFIGMEMSAIYDSTHGATLSVITPAWMKYVYTYNVERFAQFAVRVFGVEYDVENPAITAEQGIAQLQHFFEEIGAPTHLGQIGIDESRLREMADKCCIKGARGCIKSCDSNDIYEIFKLAL